MLPLLWNTIYKMECNKMYNQHQSSGFKVLASNVIRRGFDFDERVCACARHHQ